MKTLKRIESQSKEPFSIPRTVQDIIPIHRIWDDGIFQIGAEQKKPGAIKQFFTKLLRMLGLKTEKELCFSKTFRFEDINYAVASKEDQEAMFLDYSEFLNSFDSSAAYKISIIVKKLDKEEFKNAILIPMKGDALDVYREEYNKIMLEEATGSNGFIQQKYITVSVFKKTVDEARNYFARISSDLTAHLNRLGSRAVVLDAGDRLRTLHDFFRPNDESGGYQFDMKDSMQKGHSFKDYVCPDTFEFEKDHFVMGDKYGRVVFLRDYANYIKDTMVSELCDFNRNMILSIDINPIPTDEAVKSAERINLGVETNITNWQRRQNSNNNFSAIIPYDMELQRKESKEFLDDLTTRDQRMMFAAMTVVLTADTKEELDNDTETLLMIGRKHLCQFSKLNFQQMDGLNTVLPYGVRRISAVRTLTTESVAVFIPFRVQEVYDKGGIYCGINAISRNMIFCDKSKLMNPNGFRLGVPGSGKSMGAKDEIEQIAITTNDDILVCDPEGEYGIIEALGGQVIRIAAGSADHINAMDMVEGYGDSKDPIIDKSEFILSLFEQLDRNHNLSVIEKGIIDNCVRSVYENHQNGGALPTLVVLQEELRKHKDKEAEGLAKALELFTNGSLNVFAHPTNVDTQSRMVVYDILNLGSQLKTMGMLVITDAMINRVAMNWKSGKRTHIFIDELHVVFQNEYSSNFFSSAWRQFRKRNAYPTGITQNVEYLLDSITARTMLSNSEFIVMNNQAASDRVELAKLLNISEEQLGYVTNADAGCGLMRIGNSLIPFINRINPNSARYRLMSTKPGE